MLCTCLLCWDSIARLSNIAIEYLTVSTLKYYSLCVLFRVSLIGFSSWISVSDLLDYITPDAEMKAREAQRKQARAKVMN